MLVSVEHFSVPIHLFPVEFSISQRQISFSMAEFSRCSRSIRAHDVKDKT